MTLPCPLQGLHILVVEDVAELALDMSNGLRRMGAAKVELKASARQARKRLLQEPIPDVVLLDHRLVGDETGLDIALWMREQVILHRTARIAYSGTDLATLQASWPDEHVFHGVVSKPAPLEVLVQQIVQAVQAVRLVPAVLPQRQA